MGALNLTEANATVVTPHGPIQAEWKLSDDGAWCTIAVMSPLGTTGMLILPESFRLVNHDSVESTRGDMGIEIVGGEKKELIVRNW